MQTLVSQQVRRNYIRTSNPFNLQEPPKFFLDQLEAYDADLVVFPSTHEPVYRLARRKTHTLDVYKFMENYPDTAVFVAHKLAFFKSILPTSLDMSWERVLMELPEFDQWRFKNADAVADHLDAREAAAEKRLDAEIADGASQIAAPWYRVMDKTRGSRIHMNEVRGAAPRRQRPVVGKLDFRRGGSAVHLGR